MLEVMDQLLDHVAAISFWVLDYAEKNSVPIDEKLSFHLTRIDALLSEVTNPPDTCLMDRVLRMTPKRDGKVPKPLDHMDASPLVKLTENPLGEGAAS
jgi:hypothetical protein